ncbi:11708_t:CDS:2, partial [Gigaspora margarita]
NVQLEEAEEVIRLLPYILLVVSTNFDFTFLVITLKKKVLNLRMDEIVDEL